MKSLANLPFATLVDRLGAIKDDCLLKSQFDALHEEIHRGLKMRSFVRGECTPFILAAGSKSVGEFRKAADNLRNHLRDVRMRETLRGGGKVVLMAAQTSQDDLRKAIGDALSAGAITGQQASKLDLLVRHGALPMGVRDALASAAKSARS